MPMIAGVWVLAGAMSLIGAPACAELGAAFPSTGGQYVFLREAYGPLAALRKPFSAPCAPANPARFLGHCPTTPQKAPAAV
jgi:amino acid transporter